MMFEDPLVFEPRPAFVPRGTAADVDVAVAAAVDAFDGWAATTTAERIDLFRALAPRPAAASTRWHVEHEFDDEPTHVVDTLGEHDNTDVDFGPGISVPLRRTLARLVADSLNQAEQAGGAA